MFASYRIGFEHKRVNHRFGGEGWLGFKFFNRVSGFLATDQ